MLMIIMIIITVIVLNWFIFLYTHILLIREMSITENEFVELMRLKRFKLALFMRWTKLLRVRNGLICNLIGHKKWFLLILFCGYNLIVFCQN